MACRERARSRSVVVPVVAALVTFAATGVGGCSWILGPDQDTALIGDSITDQSRATFDDVLGDDHRLDVRAFPGVRTDEWVDQARLAAEAAPDAAVVNLGTNDVFQAVPPAASGAAMAEILNLLGDVPCTFVVTVNEKMVSTRGDDLPGRAAALNDELRQVAADHGARVIDWAAAVDAELAAGEPNGSLTVDTVHPTAYGESLMAGLYDDALASCDPDPSPT